MSAVDQTQVPGGELDPLARLDPVLLAAVLGLLGLGLVMVTSASIHKIHDAPFLYMNRHLLALALGLAVAYPMFRLPLATLERLGPLLYALGLAMLILVLVPGVGREVNGATRWIPIGPLNFQGSEFMKLFMVVYIAGYIVRREKEVMHTLWGFLKPMILVSVACGLILLEPDFGTTVVLMATVLGMLFLGGVPLWQFGILVAGFVVLTTLLIWLEPYRLSRVTSFMDPWADPLKSGFQLSQALIAFGRGEWNGVGLGAGIQKLFYLPEAHTDFLLAVVGEELGLAGTLAVVGLFALLVWRTFVIGIRAEAQGRRFAGYVAYGFGIWVFMQASINVGVNVGLFPTKGLTLPFMSYGSNSIIAACAIAAILLRIDYENARATAVAEAPCPG
jgi:cell division protein FtsW